MASFESSNAHWIVGTSEFEPLSVPRQLPQFVLHTEFAVSPNTFLTHPLVSGQHLEGLLLAPLMSFQALSQSLFLRLVHPPHGVQNLPSQQRPSPHS